MKALGDTDNRQQANYGVALSQRGSQLLLSTPPTKNYSAVADN